MQSSTRRTGWLRLTSIGFVGLMSVLAFALLLMSGIAQPTRAHAADPITFGPRPDITVPGTNLSTPGNPDHGAIVTFTPPTVSVDEATCFSERTPEHPDGLSSGSLFPVGSTTVRCYADADPSGLTYVDFTITVTITHSFVLTPATLTGPLPGSHTVTATVSEWGSPIVDATVHFERATGAVSYYPPDFVQIIGDPLCDSVTDAFGVATCTYAGTAVGTDTIQANYFGYLENTFFSNTVTREWTPFTSSITLAPLTNSTALPGSHTVNATVIENSAPVAGKVVTFTVISGPNTGATGPGTTNASGVATFTYPGTTTGTDTIGATYTNTMSALQTSNTVSETWTFTSGITLAPLTNTSTLPGSHTVTATVTENGSPAAGKVVTFTVVTGPNAGATGPGTTNASGEATFTYPGTTAGTDTIGATYTDTMSALQTSNTVDKIWNEAPFTSSISLTPPTATNVLPSTHTVVALVTENGSPVAGKLVTFTVLTGPNTGATGTCSASVTCMTDALGQVSFTYAGTVAGTDTIGASYVDSHEATKTATAVTKTWTAAPPTTICTIDRADDDDHDGHGSAATAVTSHEGSGPRWVNDTCVITLTPGSATNVLPSSHTVTATVKEGGVGVAGRVVTFTVLSGPNAGLTGTGTTGLDGTVAWTYAGTTKGKDVIRASYVDGAGDVELSAKVTKTWVNPPSCRDDDDKRSGGDDREGGAHASTSVAVASGGGDKGDGGGSSMGLCYITLNPTSATNVLPSSHTLTALVMEFGLPVAGKTVTFTVLTGPNAGLTGTGVTNASGVATWTYAGTTAGKDTIQAKYTNSAGDIELSGKVTKTWTVVTPPRSGGDRDR